MNVQGSGVGRTIFRCVACVAQIVRGGAAIVGTALLACYCNMLSGGGPDFRVPIVIGSVIGLGLAIWARWERELIPHILWLLGCPFWGCVGALANNYTLLAIRPTLRDEDFIVVPSLERWVPGLFIGSAVGLIFWLAGVRRIDPPYTHDRAE